MDSNIYEVKITYETERDNGSIKKEKGGLIVKDAMTVVETQAKVDQWLKDQGETRDYTITQVKHLSAIEAVIE